jgi:hypothetical protein
MTTKVFFKAPWIACLGLIMFLIPLRSVSQHQIDLTNGALQVITINRAAGVAILPAITVTDQNAAANVFWTFGATPAGATPTPAAGFATQMDWNGIRLRLPAGATEANPVPPLSTLIIDQTPTAAGSISFNVTLSDGTNTANARIDIFVSKDLDIIMVLDRSGSMVGEASPGVSRWNALKAAATNMANSYQALNRPNDQVRIVYFESTPTPASTCCNTPKIVTPAFPGELAADFAGKDPNFGGTAMGDAIRAAQAKLGPASASKTPGIIFFTDGEQNPTQILANGTGYTEPPGSIPGTGTPNHVKIFTIGFEGPGGMSSLLNNIANHTDASYHHSATGLDLGSAFTDAFNDLLSGSSPQLIARSSHAIPANGTAVTLQTFPVNNHVSKLLLEFQLGKNFEIPQLVQVLARIRVQRNGVNMLSYARPSWVGNFPNTILLALDFVTPPNQQPAINAAGQWTVAISDATLRFNTVNLTVTADDHRLHMKRTLGNGKPKVNESFPISFKLDWLSQPIKNATVEAVIRRPGEDMGHALAINPVIVDVSNAVDAGSPGRQKFNKLWLTDSFRVLFKKSDNVVPLTHTADGRYEGTFSGLTLSGTYELLIRIKGTDSAAGEIQRILSESFYTDFAGVDMSKSLVSTVITNGQLVMNIKPTTSYDKFVGPAMGNSFSVTNAAIKISSVVDHQDGKYTITFTGNVTDTTTLRLGDQAIYTGKLANAGKDKSIFDSIPAWLFWLFIILLLLLILWLIFRKKK